MNWFDRLQFKAEPWGRIHWELAIFLMGYDRLLLCEVDALNKVYEQSFLCKISQGSFSSSASISSHCLLKMIVSTWYKSSGHWNWCLLDRQCTLKWWLTWKADVSKIVHSRSLPAEGNLLSKSVLIWLFLEKTSIAPLTFSIAPATFQWHLWCYGSTCNVSVAPSTFSIAPTIFR